VSMHAYNIEPVEHLSGWVAVATDHASSGQWVSKEAAESCARFHEAEIRAAERYAILEMLESQAWPSGAPVTAIIEAIRERGRR